MRVYDCDDADDFAVLDQRVGDDDLMSKKLLQAFGPDTVAEARNRGFHQR